jgi:hypothetical protein
MHVIGVERVLQRQHRPGMGDLVESGRRGGTDPVRWAVLAHQIGKAGLDFLVAPS